jgi:hypothetical protein
MNKLVLTALLGAIAAVGGWWWLRGGTAALFQTACETEIADRLRSPSSYKRVKFDYYPEALDAEAYGRAALEELANERSPNVLKFRRTIVEDRKRDVAAGTLQPIVHSAFVSYDADNVYGTAIRGLSQCTYFDDSGDGNITDFMVKVDGDTHTDYLIKALKRGS